MKIIKYLILILIILNLSSIKAEDHINDLNIKITKNLRCLICQGQSVYDSDTEFANSVKILVQNKLRDGQSEKEIYSYLKDKYGEWILYDPEFNKNTYFLWLFKLLIKTKY